MKKAAPTRAAFFLDPGQFAKGDPAGSMRRLRCCWRHNVVDIDGLQPIVSGAGFEGGRQPFARARLGDGIYIPELALEPLGRNIEKDIAVAFQIDIVHMRIE